MTETTFMGLMNLHDAFLNASLQKKCMDAAPLEANVQTFHISDRARFERCWLAFLYVVFEAWQAPQMASIRAYIGSLVATAELDATIVEGEQHGYLEKLREARHYMCHRDRRDYWNDGRLAPVGGLDFNKRLHDAFGRTLLKALHAHEQRTPASKRADDGDSAV